MGVPGMANTGSFQTGFSYQQTQPYSNNNLFGNQPQQGYQPVFNNNGQITGQATGTFNAGTMTPPQSTNMETDNHGVPGFLRRKK